MPTRNSKTTGTEQARHDLSVLNKRLKSHLLTQNIEPSRASPTRQRKKTYWNKQHFGMR